MVKASARVKNLSADSDIARGGSEARFEAIFAEHRPRLADLPLDDGLDRFAIGRVGKGRVDADHAPFDAPSQSEDAEIRPHVVDDGSLLLVAHRGAGDAI